MNAHVFRRVCEALSSCLLGARLEKIHAPSADVTQWSFYGRADGMRQKFTILLRAQHQAPFLGFVRHKVAVNAEPPSVVMRLRKYLDGQRVTALFADWTGRRLWLRFTHEAEVWLCLDLRAGPLLRWEAPEGLDGRRTEAGPAMESSASDAEPVPLPAAAAGQDDAATGKAPEFPDGSMFFQTEAIWPTAGEIEQAGADAWKRWPVLSPLLRRTLPLLPREEQDALLVDLQAGGGDLFVYDRPDRPDELPEISAWPLPEPLRAGRREQIFEDPLAALELVSEARVVRLLRKEASERAARPYLAEAARLTRLLHKLDQEEVRLRSMAAVQTDALELQAQLYRLDPGAKCATVELKTSSCTRTLQLDPSLSVADNMAVMFHRAGRGRRGLAMLVGRRETVRAELEAARQQAALAGGLAPACHAALGGKRKAGGGQGRGSSAVSVSPRLPRNVQAFRSSDGLMLLRGRDARGNMAALKLASPDDLWLHVEGTAGAHVILRRTPGMPVPERSLQEAGMLAALKSPYRDAGTAAVQCALVKHVHPMRRAAPGMVRIDRHEPGLTVRIEEDLERRLLV